MGIVGRRYKHDTLKRAGLILDWLHKLQRDGGWDCQLVSLTAIKSGFKARLEREVIYNSVIGVEERAYADLLDFTLHVQLSFPDATSYLRQVRRPVNPFEVDEIEEIVHWKTDKYGFLVPQDKLRFNAALLYLSIYLPPFIGAEGYAELRERAIPKKTSFLSTVTGAILVGGKSSRFGSDKALAMWNGSHLVEWSARALSLCEERFLVGGTVERYGFLDLPVLPDDIPNAGPLGGLATALNHARCDRVALAACDMPALTPMFWAILAGRKADAVVPAGPDGKLEPTAAIYSRACLGPAREALAAGELRMTSLLERVRTEIVPWRYLERAFGTGLFLNANRPADLEAASGDS